MRKKLVLFCSAVVVTCASAAFPADKAVTFTAANTTVQGVDLRPTADGGFALTVYGANEVNGAAIQRVRVCEVSTLTAAQKAALAAVRAAALACWNSAEGL